jgi:DNA uptake protein ComE-like DNA-binding protein
VQQVAETYGLPDSTFQLIRFKMRCQNPALRTFDVNTTDASQLKTHPYIKWNIANAIVAYRQQHGNYKSLEDLKKIDLISEELFNKLTPYLKVL